MDLLLALISKKFHESKWTDQEIGNALGREIPIIPLKIEGNPCGFIGKVQAINNYRWGAFPKEILKSLLKYERVKDCYLKALQGSSCFEQCNQLALALPLIESLSSQQVEALIAVYNNNFQIRGSYGFEWKNKSKGLKVQLERLTGKIYDLTSTGFIV